MIDAALEKIRRIRLFFHLLLCTLSVVRWLLITTFVIGLWSVIAPGQLFEGLALGMFAFVVLSIIDGLPIRRALNREDFTLGLDMTFPDTDVPIHGESIAENSVWHQQVEQVVRDNMRNERARFTRQASTLVLPLMLNIAMITPTQSVMGSFLKTARDVVANFNQKTVLTVLDGKLPGETPDTHILKRRATADLRLSVPNLIRIEVINKAEQGAPVVVLTDLKADAGAVPYQSFQMSRQHNKPASQRLASYAISFAVTKDVRVTIPNIAGDATLATIEVKKPPIPQVSLQAVSKLTDPWPDDREVQLAISVQAKNPIKIVRLLIRAGKRESKELVNLVTAEDLRNYSTTYGLLLEPYIDSDLADVEIVAEAIDQAIPTPLVGRSPPLRIRTASAYGRYRQTLNTLYTIKSHLDAGIKNAQSTLDPQAEQLIDKAVNQAEKTPFFDGLDRLQLNKLSKAMEDHRQRPSVSGTHEISHELNRFLQEHEILDDRERDRDFFVAVRGLSRLLERPKSERLIDVGPMIDRIKDFVGERRDRWEQRMKHVSDPGSVASWRDIKERRPFLQSLDKVRALDADSKLPYGNQQAIAELSKSAAKYRAWIEELEAAEDKARMQREQQRQQGLADARNQLKEIQKLQNTISSSLDRAGIRERGEMSDRWPSVRMKENTNIEATSRLERKMRSLAPGSAKRLHAALQAMELTKENGNQQNFVQAESFSDLASRLLRQAAKSSSQQQQQRRRRRRRVTGDQYYGQAVHGGDVEINREYQVDKRYREDILDEIQSSDVDESNRVLLDNYLRRVVR